MEKLEELFSLQTTLVNHYIKIYGLPPIPLIIDDKNHQEVVRHLISSIIEEISESFTIFQEIYDLYNSEPDLSSIPKQFKEFNHELSDTLHFFIELLLYTNITPDSIASYVEDFLKQNNLSDGKVFKCTLNRLFFITRENRARAGIKESNINPLFKEILGIYRGGKNINQQSIGEIPLIMWSITHNLNLAQNELKNKAWKQTQVATNVKEFQAKVLTSFIKFIDLLSTLSHNAESTYLLYREKNELNLKRIESKY